MAEGTKTNEEEKPPIDAYKDRVRQQREALKDLAVKTDLTGGGNPSNMNPGNNPPDGGQ